MNSFDSCMEPDPAAYDILFRKLKTPKQMSQ